MRASEEQSRRPTPSVSAVERHDADDSALPLQIDEGDLEALEEGDVSCFLPSQFASTPAQTSRSTSPTGLPLATTTPRATPGRHKRLQLSPGAGNGFDSVSSPISEGVARQPKRARTSYADVSLEASIHSGAYRTPRRSGNHLTINGSQPPLTTPRSPAMRVLGGLASILSPFSRARSSAAFGIEDEQVENQQLVETVARQPLPESDDETDEEEAEADQSPISPSPEYAQVSKRSSSVRFVIDLIVLTRSGGVR